MRAFQDLLSRLFSHSAPVQNGSLLLKSGALGIAQPRLTSSQRILDIGSHLGTSHSPKALPTSIGGTSRPFHRTGCGGAEVARGGAAAMSEAVGSSGRPGGLRGCLLGEPPPFSRLPIGMISSSNGLGRIMWPASPRKAISSGPMRARLPPSSVSADGKGYAWPPNCCHLDGSHLGSDLNQAFRGANLSLPVDNVHTHRPSARARKT